MQRLILTALLTTMSVTLACVAVGTGTRTIVTAPVDTDCPTQLASHRWMLNQLPHLLADGCSEAPVLYVGKNGQVGHKPRYSKKDYVEYMTERYGSPGYVPVSLGVTVRNRTRLPAFTPVDYRKAYAAALFASKLPEEQVETRFEKLKHQPDMYESTTLTGTKTLEGRGVLKKYKYFPRISVDLSANVRTPSPEDEISFLYLAVRLSDTGVRFIDFHPKDADFAEFSRGQLTQTLQAQASLEASSSATEVSKLAGDDTVPVDTSVGQQGLSVSLSYSDAYVTQLKDAIERRTTGVIEEGRTFVAMFRSLRELRIGGTYNFDLMLEVPAAQVTGDDGKLISWEPTPTEVYAEILVVAVVRHVKKRGMTGTFKRVPESENDRVFEQVVFHPLSTQRVWWWSGESWVGFQELPEYCTIEIYTNRDDATFVIESPAGSPRLSGAGKKAVLDLPSGEDGQCEVGVRFLPITVVTPSGEPLVLGVDQPETFLLKAGDSKRVVGSYRP